MRHLVKFVSIPYRYATNRIFRTHTKKYSHVSIPYRYATNMVELPPSYIPHLFQSLIGTLQIYSSCCNFRKNIRFQSLIGTLQIEYLRQKETQSRGVSIPYRYATNFKRYNRAHVVWWVSIPYRYATNNIWKIGSIRGWAVSIPYRYATNWLTWNSLRLSGQSFNPL